MDFFMPVSDWTVVSVFALPCHVGDLTVPEQLWLHNISVFFRVKIKVFSTHLPPLCLFVGVHPLQVHDHFLGHPGTHLAAHPLPASPLQSAGEKLSPLHSPLLWGSAGSTGPAEPQTQPQPGFSYLLFFQLQNPLVWSFQLLSLCRPMLNPTFPTSLHQKNYLFFFFSPFLPPPTRVPCNVIHTFLLQQGNFCSSTPYPQPQCQAGWDWARQRWSGRGVGIGREGREVGYIERDRERERYRVKQQSSQMNRPVP